MTWVLSGGSQAEHSQPPRSSPAALSLAGLRAARPTTQTIAQTLSPSTQSAPGPAPSPLSSRSSWSRAPWVGWGLSLWSGLRGPLLTLLALLILASAPGCCSPPALPLTLPAPLLPVGQPPDRSAEILSQLDASRVVGGEWTISAEALDLILADRLEWQAWAEALRAAGRWRAE